MPCLADELRSLRAMAERCYRLARNISDPATTAVLNALGRETDARIATLEADASVQQRL
jgi:hypothetical protein